MCNHLLDHIFHVLLLDLFFFTMLIGILPEIQDKNRNGFHVSVDDKEAGFLQTSFILSFMVFSPIFGYLGDRYTRKYLMATGLFIWAGFVLVGSFSTVSYVIITDWNMLQGFVQVFRLAWLEEGRDNCVCGYMFLSPHKPKK